MNDPNQNPPRGPGPIGTVKVKIKDGNGHWHYITYDGTNFATDTDPNNGFQFTTKIDPANGRVQYSTGDTYYLASDGTTVVRSDHPTTPEWTHVTASGTTTMHIHDNTREYIAIDNNGRLSVGTSGCEVKEE